MKPIPMLLTALGAFALYYIFILAMAARDTIRAGEEAAPPLGAFVIGVVANFFDTLGIGSFAPTTSAFRALKMVPDERIPGTLNVGYASAALFESFLFIGAVDVSPSTLVLMIAAAILGAWTGAGFFARWPRRKIQLGMGVALFAAGALFIYKNVHGDPVGGLATSLTGTRLVVGLVGNFVLGILMTIGVGLYAPCMLLVTLLGMNPGTAFPIMMGSAAFLMPIASARFLKEGAASVPVSLALSVSALPGVFLAYKFFTSLDVTKLQCFSRASCFTRVLCFSGPQYDNRTTRRARPFLK